MGQPDKLWCYQDLIVAGASLRGLSKPQSLALVVGRPDDGEICTRLADAQMCLSCMTLCYYARGGGGV